MRWAAAYSEAELIEAAPRAVRDRVQWDEDEDLMWVIREPVVLFDAASPGTEIEPDNRLVINTEPGHYRVRATYLKDHSNWMVLVQLQSISDVGDAGD